MKKLSEFQKLAEFILKHVTVKNTTCYFSRRKGLLSVEYILPNSSVIISARSNKDLIEACNNLFPQ